MKPASEVNESLGNVFFWQLVYYGGLEGIQTFMGILEYTGGNGRTRLVEKTFEAQGF